MAIALSPELTTILVSMTPVGELRAGLPLALTVYEFSVLKSLLLSYIGNTIPVLVIIFGFRWIMDMLSSKLAIIEKWNTWVEDHVRQKWEKKYKRYGALALFLFTAIPLPLTGVWSASIASILFQIPKKQSFAAILAGMIVAGGIVSLITLGIIDGVDFFVHSE